MIFEHQSKHKIMLFSISALTVIVGIGCFVWQNMNKAPDMIGCTLEAKVCPDGSAVGRTGPNCEFAPCRATASRTFGNPQVEKAITDFLLTQRNFSWKNEARSYNFCAIENLAPEQELFPLYVWVFCAEFAEVNGELKEVGGSSIPARINYPNELSFYDTRKFTADFPRDGSYYTPDIKTIFPDDVVTRIFGFDPSALTLKLHQKASLNLTSWNAIKTALEKCEVKSLFQNHSNEVSVKLKNGGELSAVEPTIDEIMHIASASSCGKIQMATE